MIVPELFLKKSRNPVLDKFKRPMAASAPIIGDIGDYQMDLSFENDYASFNSGYKVLLNIVHVPSRYLYSKLLKGKGECADALIEMIPKMDIPVKVLTYDAGKEFVNKKLIEFLEKNDITSNVVNKEGVISKTYQLSSYNLSIIERLNGTIRMLVERWIAYAQNEGINSGKTKFNYSFVYSQLIDQYNNTEHSSIDMSPKEALDAILNPSNNKINTLKLLKSQGKLISKTYELKEKIKERFLVGKYVRVMLKTNNFVKGAVAKFSDEVYKIVKVSGLRVFVEKNGREESFMYHDVILSSVVEKKSVVVGPSKQQVRSQIAIAQSEKRENISKENIVEGKRERKVKKILDL